MLHCILSLRNTQQCMTVQGNCSTEPSVTGSPALVPVRPRQCLLTVRHDLMGWLGKETPADVWLHNLYIRSRSASDGLIFTQLQWRPSPPARLWLTDLTLQGGMRGLTTAGPTYAASAHLCHLCFSGRTGCHFCLHASVACCCALLPAQHSQLARIRHRGACCDMM